MSFILEVCIDSVESAMAAEAGGADRVELCDNLTVGGTTPSAGAVAVCQKHVTLEVFVMIRPRGGDFLYSDMEYETMRYDIDLAKSSGVRGVVFGILTPEGKVDRDRTQRLIDAARPLSVTFHRAFDMTVDPFEALEDLIGIGVDRILTSGQAATAEAGTALIAKLVKQAGDRTTLLPGCGINENNLAHIVANTGVHECHVSGKGRVPSGMTYMNPAVSMGVCGAREYERVVVDPNRIRAFRTIVDGAEGASRK